MNPGEPPWTPVNPGEPWKQNPWTMDFEWPFEWILNGSWMDLEWILHGLYLQTPPSFLAEKSCQTCLCWNQKRPAGFVLWNWDHILCIQRVTSTNIYQHLPTQPASCEGVHNIKLSNIDFPDWKFSRWHVEKRRAIQFCCIVVATLHVSTWSPSNYSPHQHQNMAQT